MRVAIRADASHRIGSGHIIRCVTLAERLRLRGAAISFVCRELPGHYCGWLENRGFAVTRLPARADFVPHDRSGDEYAAMLGESMKGEIEQSCVALAALGKVDWLVVDHYGLDSSWYGAMRPHVGRIMAIDDLANRSLDVELLLDQNFQTSPHRYLTRVPGSCIQLLGPAFALLRPDFRTARERLKPRDGAVRRILVFLGGSDPENQTARVLDACKEALTPDVEVHVVVGQATPNRADLERRCSSMPRAQLHVQAPNMAELMSQADLMLGAAGSTTWERCCLGLPGVLVSIAANQRDIGRSIADRGAGLYLGDIENVRHEDFVRTISGLMRDPLRLREMAANAHSLVDGLGAERVAAYF